MRNLLAFAAALVLTVTGVGLYLGWFKVGTVMPGQGRRTVNIDVNTEKIGDDLRDGGEYLLQEGGEKLHEVIERKRNEAGTPRAEGSPKDPAAPGPKN